MNFLYMLKSQRFHYGFICILPLVMAVIVIIVYRLIFIQNFQSEFQEKHTFYVVPYGINSYVKLLHYVVYDRAKYVDFRNCYSSYIEDSVMKTKPKRKSFSALFLCIGIKIYAD